MNQQVKFVAASLLLLPSMVKADADEVMLLPPVDISPGTFSEAGPNTTTSNLVIDEQEIRGSSATNLSELLTEHGFAVQGTPTDYGENTLSIRGFHTEHLQTEVNGNVLILIDGRRSGVANVRQIELDNVARIEVLRGAEMFKYSMGSPGGIINVITKRGGPDRFGGSVRAGYGSNNASRIGVDVNGQVDNVDYLVGYDRRAIRSDYKDGKGNRVHNTKTDGIENMNFNIGYTFDNNHRIGIDGYRHTVDKAHRPSYIDEEGELRSNSYTDRETQLLYLNYEGETSDNRFSWQADIGQGKDKYESFFAGSTYPKGQNVETDRAQGIVNYNSSRFDLSGSLSYIKYDVENSASVRGKFLSDGGLDPEWAGVGYPMHETSQTTLWGASVVGTLKLMEDTLNLSGGLRYEHAKAKDLAIGDEHYHLVPYFANQGITSRDQLPTRRNFDHLSPTFGVSWLPADWIKLRANYTEGWRAPSGRQLFASSFYEDYGAPGEPRLKPELTDAFEFGFDMQRKDWMLSATYFYYKIKNNIYIYPAIHPDGSGKQGGRVMTNVDKRIQEGIELQASTDIASLLGHDSFELRPYVSATHMLRKEEVLDKGGPGLMGTWWPIARMPDTMASYGVRLNQPSWSFSGDLNFSYYGKHYGRSSVGDGPLEGMGRFTVANLSMTKRLWDSGNAGSLDLKLDLNNLFNENYSYHGRVPEDTYAYPGRNVFATLSYQF